MFLSLLTCTGITALRSKSSLCSTDYSPATARSHQRRLFFLNEEARPCSLQPPPLVYSTWSLCWWAGLPRGPGEEGRSRNAKVAIINMTVMERERWKPPAVRTGLKKTAAEESRGVAQVIICPFVSAQEAPGEVRFLNNTGSGDARSAEPQHPNGI